MQRLCILHEAQRTEQGPSDKTYEARNDLTSLAQRPEQINVLAKQGGLPLGGLRKAQGSLSGQELLWPQPPLALHFCHRFPGLPSSYSETMHSADWPPRTPGVYKKSLP